MNHADLQTQIEEARNTFAAATSDGSVTLKEFFAITSSITHAAAVGIADMADPVDGCEDIITACERAYDEFIQPIDIVGVPGTLESYVKRWARETIRPTVTQLVNFIAG